MKPLISTLMPLILSNLAVSAASISYNSGSLGSAGNGSNSDSVTTGNVGVLGGDDRAAGYPTPASPLALTTIGHRPELNPASGSPFTVEFWANPASTAGNPNSAPLSNRVSSGNRSGWAFFQRTNAWSFIMYNGSGGTAGWDLTGGTAPVDAWSHVVATWTGSAALLYVNGILADDTNSGAGGYNASATATFTVGGLFDSSSPFRGGLIDEVAFYNTALSAGQIQNHFNVALNNPLSYQATVRSDGAVLQLTNIPEPTGMLLLGIGGVALIGRRTRRGV